MRERNKTLPARPLSVRLWTLKDKKSMFRASNPDVHIVELSSKNVVLRDWAFDTTEAAQEQYLRLIKMLGD